MSVQDLLSVLSPLVIILGALYGVSMALWRRFEKRMDKGDKAILEKIDEGLEKVANLDNRVNALELSQAEMRGAQSVLVTIYANKREEPKP